MQKDQKNNAIAETSFFIKEVGKYFMNFLETDFKKRRIPKRNTIQKTQKGLKVGFDLEKYAKLKKDLFNLLNSGFKKDSINIKKGDYTRNVPKSLLNLIKKKIEDLQEENLKEVFKKTEKLLKEKAVLYTKEYDKFLEETKEDTKQLFSKNFILPFLDDLDKPLENLELADENSKFQLEVDITDVLFSVFEERFTEVLQSFFQKEKDFDLQKSLSGMISLQEIQDNLVQFFENFAIADAFYDLYQIYRNNQLIDKTEIYLYFYEISLGNEKFPVIYLPITIQKEEKKFTLQFEKRLFINTKAIDFVVQEFNTQFQKKDTLAGEFDRIIYINGEDDFFITLETIIRKIENFFELNRNIDLQNSELQKGVNLLTSLSNKSYFFLFDKSDESLINDYEEILNDNGELLNDFSLLLNGFVENEPKPFMEDVDDEWHEKSTPERLTFESPIPLNDEQKQVLMALQKPDCRFLILEGPPGTGKSHTITAIICKALLEEKSVLVLSDKKEALDVVEDKISETLNKIRREDDFQNPILRLGKSGNKFYKIVSGQTVSKIREHYRAYKHKKESFVNLKQNKLEEVKANLEENIAFFEDIKMKDIAFYFENLGVETNLSNAEKELIEKLESYLNAKDFQIEDLERIKRIFSITKESKKFFDENFTIETLEKFSFTEDANSFEATKAFNEYVEKITQLKKPLIGYLFQGGNILNATQEIKKKLPFFDIENPEKELKLLKKVESIYSFIASKIEDEKDFSEVIKNLQEDDFQELKQVVSSAEEFLKNENLKKFLQLRDIRNKLEKRFKNQPKDIYFQSIHEIEDLVTAQMTHFLDERIISYVDKCAGEANNLKTIIRKKEKFPKDLFANLKKAFPCILAGIRDYAEYIPLEKELFDLIIIDEASQVSIAQALPALIRGKKIVILGDDKQFSNVKSNNASTVTNQQYKSKVLETFKAERVNGEDKRGWLNKVKENFDIKNSILKFMRFIRNYECLLKKHFRCYPEIISYSDKYFYGSNLQSMKIRGKGIEEVIRFDIIDHDGKFDETKNTNELEVEFIINKLKEFKKKDIVQSLGIITPHREQVSLLWDRINNLSEKDWLFEKCRLKIMTFDTCQGEERDYIFYSMVATKEKDRLNWIFLKDFSSLSDEVDGTIKSQRLNVGFSRAKECIHFVLSKPVEEFSGEIKNAMQHYQGELEVGKKKIIGGTDENSGMEHKIQHYFYETKFYKENKDEIEFIPQFELGKYLRQLDKNYRHPNYKVDFLLIFKDQKIVIEYDGFREHFENRDEVNEANYSFYMKDDDVYRQKVLEGYGYKFLRINRFNIGDDPIETLDKRISNLVKKNSKIRER
jgi:very-short-patch-repair endonuclease